MMTAGRPRRRVLRDPKVAPLRSIVGPAARDRDLVALAGLFDAVACGAGQVLAREGQASRSLLLIAAGEATVTVGGAGSGVLGPGDIVGEDVMLSHEPSPATVTARTPMHVLVAGPECWAALGAHPALLRHVASRLAGRLRRAVDSDANGGAPARAS
jgi:CRP-like cAMP-binding protein